MRDGEAFCAMQDSALDMLHSQQNKAAGGWMDTILNLIPGRKQQAANEPSEEAIKRTHEFLRYTPACVDRLGLSPKKVMVNRIHGSLYGRKT